MVCNFSRRSYFFHNLVACKLPQVRGRRPLKQYTSCGAKVSLRPSPDPKPVNQGLFWHDAIPKLPEICDRSMLEAKYEQWIFHNQVFSLHIFISHSNARIQQLASPHLRYRLRAGGRRNRRPRVPESPSIRLTVYIRYLCKNKVLISCKIQFVRM